jgi:hypothetical protein
LERRGAGPPLEARIVKHVTGFGKGIVCRFERQGGTPRARRCASRGIEEGADGCEHVFFVVNTSAILS